MQLTKLIFIVPLLLIPSTHANEKIELTAFTSYRIGGDFDETESDTSINLEDGNGFGLIFNWHYDKGRQGELLFSQYNTDITYNDENSKTSEITISYLHVGGNIQVSHGTVPLWISGGLGATHFSPDGKNLDSETKLSASLGLNSRFNLTDNLSLRFEGLVYGTFFDTDSTIFCTTANCAIYVENEIWVQTELMAGLTYTFN